MIHWKIFKGQTNGAVYYDVTAFQGYLLGGYGTLTRAEYIWYLEFGSLDGFSV